MVQPVSVILCVLTLPVERALRLQARAFYGFQIAVENIHSGAQLYLLKHIQVLTCHCNEGCLEASCLSFSVRPCMLSCASPHSAEIHRLPAAASLNSISMFHQTQQRQQLLSLGQLLCRDVQSTTGDLHQGSPGEVPSVPCH